MKRRKPVDPEEKLPTPPPDPQVNKQEQIREINGDPISSSYSPTTDECCEFWGESDDAFAHMIKINALTEQILDMRDKSAKLFTRVRQLERAKASMSIDKALDSTDDEVFLPDEDIGFAESLLSAILASDRVARPRFSQSKRNLLKRQRSSSLGIQKSNLGGGTISDKEKSVESVAGATSDNRRASDDNPVAVPNGPKISKWTKVKAAFKWERACPADASSGAVASRGTLNDTRYLEIPEGIEPKSSNNSQLSSSPTPATVSSSSSMDEREFTAPKESRSLRHTGRSSVRTKSNLLSKDEKCRRSRSLDGDVLSQDFVAIDGKMDKGHKSAWGMVKDIIHSRRETPRRSRGAVNDHEGGGRCSVSSVESSSNLQEQQSPSETLEDDDNIFEASDVAACCSKPEIVTLANHHFAAATPTLMITVASSSDLGSFANTPDSMSSISPNTRPSSCHGFSEDEQKSKDFLSFGLDNQQQLGSWPKIQRQDSKWGRVKRAFLTSASTPTKNVPSAATIDHRNSYQANDSLVPENLDKSYNQQSTDSSQEILGGSSSRVGSSARDKDVANALLLLGEDRLTPEFRKKLEEWKNVNKNVNNNNNSQKSKSSDKNDWKLQLWRSRTTNSAIPTLKHRSLHRRFSEDVQKTLKKSTEKRRKKATPERKLISENEIAIKNSTPFDPSEFRPLERVLYTFERERKRLEKQRGKLNEHRASFASSCFLPIPTKDVLIQTSTGCHRFEGISREFTKKLYEWERNQGISPESSTFRLLQPSQGNSAGTITLNYKEIAPSLDAVFRGFVPKRSKSVGSVLEGNLRAADYTRKFATPIPGSSSLSLDDAEKLKNIVAERVNNSEQDLMGEENSEEAAAIDSEPEATIVDIEDVIEETASPITRTLTHQTPVYSVAASETTSIAIPCGTVTSSHEPSPVILVEAGEVCPTRLMNSNVFKSTGSLVTSSREDVRRKEQTLSSAINLMDENRASGSLENWPLKDLEDAGSEHTVKTTLMTVPEFRSSPPVKKIVVDESTLNSIVVPTLSSSELMAQKANEEKSNKKRNVIVKTKRIIFSPFRRDSSRQTSLEDAESVNLLQKPSRSSTTSESSSSSSSCCSPTLSNLSLVDCSKEPKLDVSAMNRLSLSPSEIACIEDLAPADSERSLRIKKAKEDFLSRGANCSSVCEDPRTSKESSVEPPTADCVKSASAGMISIESNAYEKFSRDQQHQQPCTSQTTSTAIGRLAKIADKFNKVRLSKRTRDNKFRAISALCRQSLLIDVASQREQEQSEASRKNNPSRTFEDDEEEEN